MKSILILQFRPHNFSPFMNVIWKFSIKETIKDIEDIPLVIEYVLRLIVFGELLHLLPNKNHNGSTQHQ